MGYASIDFLFGCAQMMIYPIKFHPRNRPVHHGLIQVEEDKKL